MSRYPEHPGKGYHGRGGQNPRGPFMRPFGYPDPNPNFGNQPPTGQPSAPIQVTLTIPSQVTNQPSPFNPTQQQRMPQLMNFNQQGGQSGNNYFHDDFYAENRHFSQLNDCGGFNNERRGGRGGGRGFGSRGGGRGFRGHAAPPPYREASEAPPPYTPFTSDTSLPQHLYSGRPRNQENSRAMNHQDRNFQGSGGARPKGFSRMKGSQSCINLGSTYYSNNQREKSTKSSREQTDTKKSGNAKKDFSRNKNDENPDSPRSDKGEKPNSGGKARGKFNSNDKGHRRNYRDNHHFNKNKRDGSKSRDGSSCDHLSGKKGEKGAKRYNKREKGKLAKKELLVSLSFKTCFKDAAVLKECILSSIQFPSTSNFEYSFVETILNYKKEEAFCKIVTSGIDVEKIKELVEAGVVSLISKLKKLVEVSFEETESKKPGKIEKQNKDSSAVPSKISFKIEKRFPSKSEFMNFLQAKTNRLPFVVDIIEDSIGLFGDTGTSKCFIQAISKADAKRIIKSLSILEKDTGCKVTASIVKQGETDPTPNDSNVPTNQLSKQKISLSKKMGDINVYFGKVTRKCLNEHAAKISQIESEVRKNRKQSVWQSKLIEAQKQEEEFSKGCRHLSAKLENLNPSTSNAGNVTELRNLIDAECGHLRKAHPIYANRERLIEHIKSNQVTVITGDKNSGQSTQIVQYLYENEIVSGKIVSTHPEPLVTINTAEKVASEMSLKVGTAVGYMTRQISKVKIFSKIVFVHDELLLDEYKKDPLFRNYMCIIVDEVDCDCLYTDLLLGVIKACLGKREDLKVIILSTPMKRSYYMDYFDANSAVEVSGESFPVDTYQLPASDGDFENYEMKAISAAIEVHDSEKDGDILVFLSLFSETIRACDEFSKRYKGSKGFQCLQFHNQLPPDELMKVFSRSFGGDKRKIIFATKIAERSIPVDSVRYIIDTGVTSELKLDQKFKILKTNIISQSTASVRQNLVSHQPDGKCFRLYSSDALDSLVKKPAPEILSVHLEKAMIKLLFLGVNPETFDFINAPSKMAYNLAKEALVSYKAIDEDGIGITEIGRMIVDLPLDPKLSHLISLAFEFESIIFETIILVVLMSLGNDFSFRGLDENAADVEERIKSNFNLDKVDSFSWLQIYKEFRQIRKPERNAWCRSKSVDYKVFNRVHKSIEDAVGVVRRICDIEISVDCPVETHRYTIARLRKLILMSK